MLTQIEKPTEVNFNPTPAVANLTRSRVVMADLSKLKIAPDHEDLLQPHQSTRLSKSNCIMAQDITSEFFVAAPCSCDIQYSLATEYSADTKQASRLANLSKMSTLLYSKQWERWR